MSVELPIPFKPLDDDFLRLAMAAAFRSQPLASLVPDVRGVGVYALYYTPATPPEDELLLLYAARCRGGRVPLYVGVTMKVEGNGADQSPALRQRLTLHKKKLGAATDMSSDDFQCRALACDNRWAALVEQYLIQEYQPVWNFVVSGFGSNVRGAGREAQKASRWEVLHQGMLLPGETREEIVLDVARHLAATKGLRSYRFTNR